MSTQTQIQLSVEESLSYAQDSSYWDGIVAGVSLAADHAKRLTLQKIIDSRKPTPPPAQPDPAPEV